MRVPWGQRRSTWAGRQLLRSGRSPRDRRLGGKEALSTNRRPVWRQASPSCTSSWWVKPAPLLATLVSEVDGGEGVSALMHDEEGALRRTGEDCCSQGAKRATLEGSVWS